VRDSELSISSWISGFITGPNGEPPATAKAKQCAEDILSLSVNEMIQFKELYAARVGIPEKDALASWGVGGSVQSQPVEAKEEASAVKEEKKFFTIKLTGFDEKSKIKVIKEVRTITALGLKEAKDLVESVPQKIKEGIKKEEAEELIEKLKAAGAVVELE